jgi:hypothetical protein
VDPKAALEMVRAALVPAEAAPAAAPPVVTDAPVPEPAAVAATPPRTEKRRVRSKRSRTASKKKSTR